MTFSWPWCGFGLELAFRLDTLSGLILPAVLGFGLLVAFYAFFFFSDTVLKIKFFLYLLLTLALASGAVLADNLVLFLFCWEGLLIPLFAMIYLGGNAAFATAKKAFIIVGISDLCLMLGIILAGGLAGTFKMSAISLPVEGAGIAAFLLIMIGAMAKAGAMPFHSWIPDAAKDAPLPFMALFPAALEKLIGIYFLTRLALEMFKLSPASWVSILMMAIGALTILLAVMMALIQKDYKKLLSYHAISQVGYMVLGIGTALPVGIIGGLFHMFNNALYKSCLFLTGGAVEKETGTTDITQLGGLLRGMPITAACFLVAAASISGVPPFNGFFSKELLYDGALERGFIFYLAAVTGSFFTAASFLKLGHAVYFGKKQNTGKEAPWPMLLPMLILAAICILFGVCNYIPIDLIKPIFKTEVHVPGLNWTLTGITILVLLGAVANHIFGVKRAGKASGASDHIHHAPGLSYLYDRAERRWFDPYVIGMRLTEVLAVILKLFDRIIDWFYEVFVVRATEAFSWLLRRAHNGDFSLYIVWSLAGAAVVLLVLLR